MKNSVGVKSSSFHSLSSFCSLADSSPQVTLFRTAMVVSKKNQVFQEMWHSSFTRAIIFPIYEINLWASSTFYKLPFLFVHFYKLLYVFVKVLFLNKRLKLSCSFESFSTFFHTKRASRTKLLLIATFFGLY